MAVNCSVVPRAILGFAGVTAMEIKVAAVTVKLVEPDAAPSVALIVVEPTPAEVARPWEPDALLMLAVADVPDAHSACVVRFCVELSV